MPADFESRRMQALFRRVSKELAENQPASNTEGMKTYSEWKHDLIQIIGTAIAVAGLVVPLLMWGIDKQMDSIKTLIQEQDKRYEIRQAESDKRQQQWMDMEDKLIDVKTSRK